MEAKKGPFLTTNSNWFISAGGGVNIYHGEPDRKGKGGRIAPALDVSLGKWFTPQIGARLQYAGLSAKGWAGDQAAPYVDGAAKKRSLSRKI